MVFAHFQPESVMPKSLRSSGITDQLPYVKADELLGVPFVIETASKPRRDEGNRDHGIKAHDVLDFQLRFIDKARATMTLTAYSSRSKIADAARESELGPLTIEKQTTGGGTFYAIVDYDPKKHGRHQRPPLYGETTEGMTGKTPGREADALTPENTWAKDVEPGLDASTDDLPF
jgi:hypothetical protein